MSRIFGIGTDIVELERFQKTNIQSLAKRILTQNEMFDFEKSQNKRGFVAKKFSVKESVSKAFGVGIGKSLEFKDIEILKDASGKPICTVREERAMAITHKKVMVHVSVSDSKSLILTYCVVEIL